MGRGVEGLVAVDRVVMGLGWVKVMEEMDRVVRGWEKEDLGLVQEGCVGR